MGKSLGFLVARGLRAVFFAIDRAVFYLLEAAYSLVQKIAEVDIFSDAVFNDFASRVYLFLGIFMLFRIAVSLINYFLNPDSFSDSKSGMGSVLKRIIVSLILIVAVPLIFRESRTLQNILIGDKENNVLVNFVFGNSSKVGEEDYSNAGSNMSVKIFQAFFRPKEGVEEVNPETISGFESYIDQAELDEKEFDYDYKIPLSTITGGLAAWIMVMFCFDIAVRSVKLGFLQLISPVPIMSYIDPKKGDEIFKKWLSECGSTYLSLFLRLLALYLGIYIITLAEVEAEGLTLVFIILGILLFMKEVPKLVMNIFGIKDSGGFTLNPLKKIAEVPLVGKTSAAVIGGADAALHGKNFFAGAWKGSEQVNMMGSKNKSIWDAASGFKEDKKQWIHGMEAVSHDKYLLEKGRKAVMEQERTGDKTSVFKSSEFKNSYRAVKEAGKNLKEEKSRLEHSNRLIQSKQARNQDLKNRRNMLENHALELQRDGSNYAMAQLERVINEIQNIDQEVNKNIGEISSEEAKIVTYNKNIKNLEDHYESVKKHHEVVREVHQLDASTEDSINAFERRNVSITASDESYVQTDSTGYVADRPMAGGESLYNRSGMPPTGGHGGPHR